MKQSTIPLIPVGMCGRNELLMTGVDLERVWTWLCRPGLWTTWYPNSSNVHIKNQTQPYLRLSTEFPWTTLDGWLARLGALVMPSRMSRWHQR